MLKTIFLFIFAFSVIIGKIKAQVNISAQAFATVIEALKASETDQLNFGRFSTESGGGIITLSPEGIRSAHGSVILAAGTYNAGQFIINGAPGASFTIQLPEGPSFLIHRQSGESMILDNWVTDPPYDSAAIIQSSGTQTISIGASLTVGSIEQNPTGLYAGTFTLIFAYN